jgi:RNA polymerase sigma factor (sigma-70 family)
LMCRRRSALGEEEIREFLARDYATVVNGLALAYGSWSSAEDAVQEALARAWERGERGLRIDVPRRWVVTVARNLLRDRFRRFLAELRVRDRLAAGERDRDGLGSADDRIDVAAAVAALPGRQREVVVLRYLVDLEEAEIARILRLPLGTVKSSLFRARRALAAALGPEGVADGTVEVPHGR